MVFGIVLVGRASYIYGLVVNMKIILIVFAVCFVMMLALIILAPEGYEDDKGFHIVEKNDAK